MTTFIPLPAHRRLLGQHRSAARPPSPTNSTTTAATTQRRRRVVDPTNLPEALPCHNFYERMPEMVGAVGNVVLADPEELAAWLLVARPVSANEAEKDGGCLIYTPPTTDSNTNAAPQYFCITATDDEVYGRGAYYSLAPRVKKGPSELLTRSFDSDTSRDGCSEERDDATGASGSSSKLTSRCSSSVLSEHHAY